MVKCITLYSNHNDSGLIQTLACRQYHYIIKSDFQIAGNAFVTGYQLPFN
jgi:hypothetical protein